MPVPGAGTLTVIVPVDTVQVGCVAFVVGAADALGAKPTVTFTVVYHRRQL